MPSIPSPRQAKKRRRSTTAAEDVAELIQPSGKNPLLEETIKKASRRATKFRRNFTITPKEPPDLCLDGTPDWFADCVESLSEQAAFPLGGVALATLGAMSAATAGNFSHGVLTGDDLGEDDDPDATVNVVPTGLYVNIVAPSSSRKSFVGKAIQESHKQSSRLLRDMQDRKVEELKRDDSTPEGSGENDGNAKAKNAKANLLEKYFASPVRHSFSKFTAEGLLKNGMSRHDGCQFYTPEANEQLHGWSAQKDHLKGFLTFVVKAFEGEESNEVVASGDDQFREITDPRLAITTMHQPEAKNGHEVFLSEDARTGLRARFLFHYQEEPMESLGPPTLAEGWKFTRKRLAFHLATMVLRYWSDSRAINKPKPFRSSLESAVPWLIFPSEGVEEVVGKFSRACLEEQKMLRDEAKETTGKPTFRDSALLGHQSAIAVRIASVMAAYEAVMPQVESYMSRHEDSLTTQRGRVRPLLSILPESELKKFKPPQNVQYTERQFRFGVRVVQYSRIHVNEWEDGSTESELNHLADRTLSHVVRVFAAYQAGDHLKCDVRQCIYVPHTSPLSDVQIKIQMLLLKRTNGGDKLREPNTLSRVCRLLEETGYISPVEGKAGWFTLNWDVMNEDA